MDVSPEFAAAVAGLEGAAVVCMTPFYSAGRGASAEPKPNGATRARGRTETARGRAPATPRTEGSKDLPGNPLW